MDPKPERLKQQQLVMFPIKHSSLKKLVMDFFAMQIKEFERRSFVKGDGNDR